MDEKERLLLIKTEEEEEKMRLQMKSGFKAPLGKAEQNGIGSPKIVEVKD